MPSVTVFFSGHEQATYPLDKPTVIVGREEGCQIHIDNRSISRQHCAFYAKGNGFLIQDLNSANGTYVNGHKITEHCLVPGDMVIIGKYELRYNEGNTLVLTKPKESSKDAVKDALKNAPHVEEPTESYELWFYAVDGEQKGPVDVATLRRLTREKTIAMDTLVWHAGMPDWIPVSTAPGIMTPEDPPPIQGGMFHSSTPATSPVANQPAPAPKAESNAVAEPQAKENEDLGLPALKKDEGPALNVPPSPAPAPAAPSLGENSGSSLQYSEPERKTCEDLAKFLKYLGYLMLAFGALGVLGFIQVARAGYFSIGIALQVAGVIASGVVALSASVAFERIQKSDGDDRENTAIALRQMLKFVMTEIAIIAAGFAAYILAHLGIL